jgi:small subunit ribosomal protein S19
MAKKFTYRGKTIEEMNSMSTEDLSNLIGTRARRSLKRGLSPEKAKLVEKAKEAAKIKESGKEPKIIKTHLRDMVVLPQFVGLKFGIHNGKEYFIVEITEDKVGHYFGEFSQTRKRIQHGTPGVGASRSSKFVPIK